jgi:hypothetical protein
VVNTIEESSSVRLSSDTKSKIKEIKNRRLDDRQRKTTVDAIVNEAMDLLLKKTERK